jgi:fatty-acyl-CoA synthase
MGLAAATRREYIYLSSVLRTLWLLRLVKPSSTRIISDIVAAWAKKTPEAPAVIAGDEVWSYAALDARANAYAHWAKAQGLGRGAAVALLMENRPDFLCAWR